jgi:hypothetical protein
MIPGFNYLNCSNNTVLLEGVRCQVQSCSQTMINCVIGPAPASHPTPFASTTGLTTKLWWNANTTAEYSVAAFTKYPLYPNSPSVVTTTLNGLQHIREDFADFYLQQVEGIFIPPLDGNYTFYFDSDDYGDLYLSTTDKPENLTFVSSATSYTTHYWNRASQVGWRVLQAGQRYYIRARSEEHGGQDHLRVAVRIQNTSAIKTPEEQRYRSVRERQLLQLESASIREVQTVSISGVSGGRFRLFCFKGTTLIDVTSTDTGSIASTVSGLSSCNNVRVRRTANLAAFSYIYNFTFDCPTNSSAFVMTVSNFDMTAAAGQTIQFNATRPVLPSVPISGFYTLSFNGVSTLPILNTVNPESSIKALLGIGEVRIERSGNWFDSGTLLVEFITFPVSAILFIFVIVCVTHLPHLVIH